MRLGSERVAVATNKERQEWRRVRDGENPGRVKRSERVAVAMNGVAERSSASESRSSASLVQSSKSIAKAKGGSLFRRIGRNGLATPARW